ncbi:hypothetical protein OG534_00830 [Streptomyces sp. NBC_01294]|nr:hypothetical protein [Streptomyces sp. NBC_01294]WRZ55175.1 hypothetical protein OG534_00830 [Streptomyces sp. NBC_01294]
MTRWYEAPRIAAVCGWANTLSAALQLPHQLAPKSSSTILPSALAAASAASICFCASAELS